MKIVNQTSHSRCLSHLRRLLLRGSLLWPSLLLVWIAIPASNTHATLPVCHAPAAEFHPQFANSGEHVAACSALDIQPYPPTAGKHYPNWAKFQTYDQPVSPGYWLHSAEHGAVILLYNCPQGCQPELVALKAMIESLPQDTVCSNHPEFKTQRRVILAPDVRLDSAFYAVAWGWSLKSNCLDTAGIHAFYTAHYNQAAENFCNEGADFSGSRWCNEPVLGLGPRRPISQSKTSHSRAGDKGLYNRVYQGRNLVGQIKPTDVPSLQNTAPGRANAPRPDSLPRSKPGG